MHAETGRYVRFTKERHAGWHTLFWLVGMTGSSAQNVSSMSMGWGAVSPCNISLFCALGYLLAFFLGLG